MQYRYEGNIFSGEKRMELQVVPRSRRVADAGHRDRAGRPASPRPPRGRPARELRVTVDQRQQGRRRDGEVSLEVPAGWTVDAGLGAGRRSRARTKREPVRFTVTPPRGDEARRVHA